jgi:uncharacterized protein (TIGR03435 family)
MGRVLTAGVLLIAAAAVPAPRLHGQAAQTDQKQPTFEVASVKANKSGSMRSNLDLQPGGRFTAINVSLVGLIRVAYATAGPLPQSSFPDVPNWFYTDHYDIIAKAEGDTTQEQLAPMLRSLLADRFQLMVHTEARTTPIYALVFARHDDRFGPGLRRSNGECPAAPGNQVLPECRMLNAPGTIRARGIPLEALTRMMSEKLDDHRPVRDDTGLTGRFDVDLRWTPDRQPLAPLDAPPEVGRAIATIDPNGPSLFAAVQEQLGLKLESRKEQNDVIVIDHVEKPTPD